MHYLVGLGNPGEEYRETRHNVGFWLVERIRDHFDWPEFTRDRTYPGQVTKGQYNGQTITALLPESFMNNSGPAVAKLVPPAEVNQLLVAHDDVDLPIGSLRVSFNRGAGGHNGVASVIKSLGSQSFTRLRIGVARVCFWTGTPRRPTGGAALNRHVLGVLRGREKKALEALVPAAIAAFTSSVAERPELL